MKHHPDSIARVLSGEMTEGFCPQCRCWAPPRYHRGHQRLECVRLKCGTAITAIRNRVVLPSDNPFGMPPEQWRQWNTGDRKRLQIRTTSFFKGTVPPMASRPLDWIIDGAEESFPSHLPQPDDDVTVYCDGIAASVERWETETEAGDEAAADAFAKKGGDG